jgi:hypothetical protein
LLIEPGFEPATVRKRIVKVGKEVEEGVLVLRVLLLVLEVRKTWRLNL